MPDVDLPLPCDAYTGNEPFIFVSYAHKDGALVYPEIERLSAAGYRVWYDEGIDPGNEWPEEIALAIKRCALFLVYVTPNAVQSKNVRNEINFALNRGKPFVAIHLVQTDLPDGLELRMGDIHAILRYRMNEEHYYRKVEKTLPPILKVAPPAPVTSIEVVEPAVKATVPASAASLSTRDPAPGATKINPIDGAEMIWIPAGPFLMGDDDRPDNPRRSVILSGYWIYKNLVTVGQYKQYCEATKIAMPYSPGFNTGWQKEEHPIVNVSWDDAMGYCKWAGVALPTEAQWEKAARGADGRQYPWGNKWDADKAWCSKKAWGDSGGTAAVGVYGISPFGCSDMAGNVWQWCADWYDGDYMRSAPTTDPAGPPAGDRRVLRGGSWNRYRPDYFRCAGRSGSGPDVRDLDVGFRCARTS